MEWYVFMQSPLHLFIPTPSLPPLPPLSSSFLPPLPPLPHTSASTVRQMTGDPATTPAGRPEQRCGGSCRQGVCGHRLGVYGTMFVCVCGGGLKQHEGVDGSVWEWIATCECIATWGKQIATLEGMHCNMGLVHTHCAGQSSCYTPLSQQSKKSRVPVSTGWSAVCVGACTQGMPPLTQDTCHTLQAGSTAQPS